jgi:DUF2075 family protein
MRLWAGLSADFCLAAAHNQIAESLRESFFRHFRYPAPPGEVNAWRNSLRALAQVFEEGRLNDHGVLLEYRLPLTSKRLDCLVCGHDGAGTERAVIIELKQWERCEEAVGETMVLTRVGGGEREMLHPAAQVGQYKLYLEDTHTAFYEGERPIHLDACSYLHNYFGDRYDDDVLFAERFRALLETYPVFTGDDAARLSEHLNSRLDGGEGAEVLARIEESRYRPSKQLMDHVAAVIAGKPEYVLLDEQLLVFEKVLAFARSGFQGRRKTVILVKGGPGTGKSVIALNLMGRLLGEHVNAHYATGSRAFTETLRSIIGARGGVQFKYFNSYQEAEREAVDVLLCDEAHRIREHSYNRYTPRAKRSDRAQIRELLHAAKVAVFFVDDKQVVRPGEIGSAEHVRSAARSEGCQLQEYELEAQFRCAGSDGFVRWVENTLGLERTANVLWDPADAFDFRIFDTPVALESAIREKATAGARARVTAGYCWKWSKPSEDGSLVRDVAIGDWKRPWNARPESRRLARGVPPAFLWAHDPGGLDQVGCVYTAQGFEFDYVGVVWGLDLAYDLDRRTWVGTPAHSYDAVVKRGGPRFVELVKNTYRVLLTRGLKGCYVHFMDRDTERFVRSRIEEG